MGMLDNLSPLWIENQYEVWKKEPEKLSEAWRAFFTGFELGGERPAPASAALGTDEALKHSAVQSLIYRYRDIGHLLACTDPLSLCRIEHPLLSLSAFGLDNSDLDKTFHTRRFMRQSATLKEIVQLLRNTYCGSVGVEFMHIQDPEERQWLIDRMEPGGNKGVFRPEQRLMLLKKLKEAALFERQLQKKFPGQTRFSLEGGDVLIPLLDAAVAKAASLGISDIVFGMPHRGRLNVLANIFGMPYENLFAEFADNAEYGVVGEGDVKYHKGFSVDLPLPDDRSIHLTLTSNPSHLEAIDPVVEGKCRARQDRLGEEGEARVLPLLIHGDAAFSGQGVVAETLNLSQLAGYRAGGTLHIVLNNQVGFTTGAEDARSTHYATDVAKMVRAPVFHVYGDDAEAVVHVTQLALSYRDRYRKDVVVEVICYRRHGHNEGDEPYFTQPLMYEQIKLRPQLHALYEMELLGDGFDEEELKGIEAEVSRRIDQAGERIAAPVESAFLARWSGLKPGTAKAPVQSAVALASVMELSERLAAIPDGFTPHPKVASVLQKRREEEFVVDRELLVPEHELVMPWSHDGEVERRYRRAMSTALLLSLLLSIVVRLVTLPEPVRPVIVEVPERLAMMVRKEHKKPEPVKPKEAKKDEKKEAKPEEKKGEKVAEKKEEKKQAVAQEKPAQERPKAAAVEQTAAPRRSQNTGVLAFKESFKDLIDETPVPKLGAEARLSSPNHASGQAFASRSLVTAPGGGGGGAGYAAVSRNVGNGGSGGIGTAAVSRSVGGGGKDRLGRGDAGLAQVKSGIPGSGGAKEGRPLSSGARPARTDEEIQILFDRYKSALYRIYNMELRKDPTLRGKMVLRLAIEPSGVVSACGVESTNIDAAAFCDQIVDRVRKFNFGPKEGVPKTTILYPIDFLPSR